MSKFENIFYSNANFHLKKNDSTYKQEFYASHLTGSRERRAAQSLTRFILLFLQTPIILDWGAKFLIWNFSSISNKHVDVCRC